MGESFCKIKCLLHLKTVMICSLYRNRNQLDEDRLQLLNESKKELCEKINLKTGELLDKLVEKEVITEQDKQHLMVRTAVSNLNNKINNLVNKAEKSLHSRKLLVLVHVRKVVNSDVAMKSFTEKKRKAHGLSELFV